MASNADGSFSFFWTTCQISSIKETILCQSGIDLSQWSIYLKYRFQSIDTVAWAMAASSWKRSTFHVGTITWKWLLNTDSKSRFFLLNLIIIMLYVQTCRLIKDYIECQKHVYLVMDNVTQIKNFQTKTTSLNVQKIV